MLAGLVQKEMLIPDGYGRGMTYKINETYGVTQGTKVKLKVLTQENVINEEIIKLIKKNNKITQQEIADILECSKRTVLEMCQR